MWPRIAIFVRPFTWTYWITFLYALGRYLVSDSSVSYRWLSASNNGYGSAIRSSLAIYENDILGFGELQSTPGPTAGPPASGSCRSRSAGSRRVRAAPRAISAWLRRWLQSVRGPRRA